MNFAAEDFKYFRQTITDRDIYDALKDLEAWEAAACSGNESIETPEELIARISKLEAVAEKPKDYDHLKSFFDDCVEALNKRWPAAEPWDMNLRNVIVNAISRGDVEDEE